MKVLFGKTVALGFALALLVLAAVGWSSYRSLTQLVEASARQHQTVEALAQLERLLAAVTDAETARRGYLVTGSEVDLENYRAACDRSGPVMQDLRRLASDSPAQRQRLDALEPAVAQRLANLEESFTLAGRQPGTTPEQRALTVRGRELQNTVRRLIHEMEDEENRLLRERDEEVGARTRATTAVSVLGSLLAFALVALASYLTGRETRARVRAQDELQRANDELDAHVRQRTAELANANDALQVEVAEHRRTEAALQASAEHLRVLSQQLLETQENERRNLAHELHDEVGQTLTALKINLQVALRSAGEKARPQLAESVALVASLIEQVRSLSLDLRPPLLDDLGLAAALRGYVDRQASRAGLDVRLDVELGAAPLPNGLQMVCFRVVQEALTNVLRHARARRVDIVVRRSGDGLELVVRDDGVGFDVANAERGAADGKGLGLLGIRERVELAGGVVDILSAPARGTEIHAQLPLPAH